MLNKTAYDLVLMDHMMPELDGIETLHILRGKENGFNSNTKVVVLTANVMANAESKYIAEGFDAYLEKPLSPALLEQCLASLLPPEKISFEK